MFYLGMFYAAVGWGLGLLATHGIFTKFKFAKSLTELYGALGAGTKVLLVIVGYFTWPLLLLALLIIAIKRGSEDVVRDVKSLYFAFKDKEK